MRPSYTVACCVVLTLSGCATTPLASRAAFSEQVLLPYAAKRGDILIDDLKTRAAKGSGVPWALLGTMFGHPLIGGAIYSIESTSIQQKLDALEAQRSAAKAKFLSVYEAGLISTDDYFAFCTQGKERRYQRVAGFPRLNDGTGSCPTTQITLDQ